MAAAAGAGARDAHERAPQDDGQRVDERSGGEALKAQGRHGEGDYGAERTGRKVRIVRSSDRRSTMNIKGMEHSEA